MQIFDKRHVTTTKEMFEAMCEHLEYSTNDGKRLRFKKSQKTLLRSQSPDWRLSSTLDYHPVECFLGERVLQWVPSLMTDNQVTSLVSHEPQIKSRLMKSQQTDECVWDIVQKVVKYSEAVRWQLDLLSCVLFNRINQQFQALFFVFELNPSTLFLTVFIAVWNVRFPNPNVSGNIRAAITIFPPRTDGRSDFKVWNKLLIHFAGYRQPDGGVIGDPAHATFTEVRLPRFKRIPGRWFTVLCCLFDTGSCKSRI